MRTGLSSTSDFATSVATGQSSVLEMAMPTMPKLTREFKNYREGTKRSRRLAEESTESYDDEVRKINQLVSYLRLSRGWLEFRPSSRRGSGTATYGYIPSSIASFIRNGTISQRTVLDQGTLGVHYALDWEGYGGLKAMIATFGEDYSPYPTEEMMEQSRVTEWEDVSFVAAILANLDHSAAIECEQSDPEVVKSEEEALNFFDNDNIYGSSDESDDLDSEDSKTQEVENTLHPVTDDNLLQCKDPSIPPSADIGHQVFSHWQFGLR
jgi:hypothetical protein